MILHRTGMRTHSFRKLLLLVQIGLLAGLTCCSRKVESNADSSGGKSEPARANTIIADPRQLQHISVTTVPQKEVAFERDLPARVGFNEERLTPVFTPYTGRVVTLLANKGSFVRRGQPLVYLDSAELITAENDLTAARSDAARARISLNVSTAAAERARRLNEAEALAAKDLQMAEADLARAQDDYRRTQLVLRAAETRLTLFGKTAPEIAQLGTEKWDRRVVLHAPITGTVVDRKVGPGQYVKPDSAEPLFLISDLSTVWVWADVYENDLGGLRPNGKVEVTVPAYPGRVFPARIEQVSPALDPATRTARLRCVLPNPGGLLKAEMFASVHVRNSVVALLPAVPRSAVLFQGNKNVVLVERKPGQFEQRAIDVGPEVSGWITVQAGLHPGERVVSRGTLLLSATPEREP